MSDVIQVGDRYTKQFVYSQADVEAFAQVTGDHNPVHLDPDYAATTVYKKPIIHGMLGASAFSTIFGNEFPGEGTVFLSHSFSFRRPMYVGLAYEAICEVVEVNPDRHKAVIKTTMMNVADGKPVLQGEAALINKSRF
mgnify:CR=1 FL=1